MKPRARRAAAIAVGLAAIGVASALVLNAFQSNLVFFYSPSQVAAREAPRERSFRIGGLVEAGSLARQPNGLTVQFTVTDLAKTVPVVYTGLLPDLFSEGKGVVAQGRLGADGVFRAEQVLAKHDENYMPPAAADALARARATPAAGTSPTAPLPNPRHRALTRRTALAFPGRAATAAVALAAVALAAPSFAADRAPTELVARGKYLAQLGGCAACHTAKNGPAYAGGLYIETPFGKIASSNITPDKATGIGNWSDDDFYRAMHDGIGRHGEYLYPVMPYPWYTKVTRDDVAAIKAYLFTQPAVRRDRAPLQLHFPFSIREALLAWRAAFFKPGTFKADETKSAEVNRGAYLVNGLGHCGECHNSLPVAGDSKWSKRLQGNVIENWFAPNITSDARDGIGAWSNEQIAAYLKTGFVPGKGVALGPMAETVHSLSGLDDADLLSIAAYLKSTPAVADAKDAKAALYQGAQARGAEPYLSHCASCHGTTGKGLAGAVPGLEGTRSVVAGGPQNVISIVIGGIEAHGDYGPMPAVGAGMSDQDVADVANYVRQLGGNAAPTTAEAGMVAAIRASTDTLMNAGPRDGCPKAGSPAAAKAVAAPAIAAQLRGLTDADLYAQTQALVAAVRKAAPRLAQADLINGLTAAYCPIVRSDPQLDANGKALKLGHYSQLVYSAASGGGVRVSAAAMKTAPAPARR